MQNQVDPASLLKDFVDGSKTDRQKKDTFSRLHIFGRWLEETGGNVLDPDLQAFVKYLEEDRGLSASSCNAYTSTIRAIYKRMMKAPEFKHRSQQTCEHPERPHRSEQELEELHQIMIARLTSNHHRLTNEIEKPAYRHLTLNEIATLLNAPTNIPFIGLRDRSILALLITTGLRKTEIVKLTVNDLRASIDGQPAIHVPAGQGSVERLIPLEYAFRFSQDWVSDWLEIANISDGLIFRGTYKAKADSSIHKLRDSMSPSAVERSVKRYSTQVFPDKAPVTPMDLRRMNAWFLYQEGVSPNDIMSRLGIKNANTFIRYIELQQSSDTIDEKHHINISAFEFFRDWA